MPIENINLGTAPTGEGGDTLRESFNKVNTNFSQVVTSDMIGTQNGVAALGSDIRIPFNQHHVISQLMMESTGQVLAYDWFKEKNVGSISGQTLLSGQTWTGSGTVNSDGYLTHSIYYHSGFDLGVSLSTHAPIEAIFFLESQGVNSGPVLFSDDVPSGFLGSPSGAALTSSLNNTTGSSSISIRRDDGTQTGLISSGSYTAGIGVWRVIVGNAVGGLYSGDGFVEYFWQGDKAGSALIDASDYAELSDSGNTYISIKSSSVKGFIIRTLNNV